MPPRGLPLGGAHQRHRCTRRHPHGISRHLQSARIAPRADRQLLGRNGHRSGTSRQSLRRFPRRRRHLFQCEKGRNLRFPRGQRRRQDHCHAHAHRTQPAHRRERSCGGLRYSHRTRANQAPHWLHEPEILALRRPHRGRKHPFVRRNLWSERQRDTPKDRCAAQSPPILRTSQHVGGALAARVETKTGLFGEHLPRSARCVPRRTDRRGRSRDAPPVLGIDLRRCSPRHHRFCHHPLHGRGRILRPHFDHGGW